MEAFGKRDDGRPGVRGQVVDRALVDGQRAQRHLLALAAEFFEVEVDGLDETDGRRVVDDRVRVPGLVCPSVKGEKRRFRDAGQQPGIHVRVVPRIHHAKP